MTRRSENEPVLYRNPGDVPGLQESWTLSQAGAPFFRYSYADYTQPQTAKITESRCVAVMKTDAGRDLSLPFTIGPLRHNFTIGERRLGSLSGRALWLANPWMAEGHDPRDIARLMAHVMGRMNADFIALDEIPEASSLRAALDVLPWHARRMTIGRKESLHWLIDMPDSFDGYLEGLSASTRQSTKRKIRKLQKDFEVRFETISDADSVARFLVEGEKISRRTYQWHVGQRLVDDAETRARYMALAQQGRLRCYLLSLDGVPRAFLRGTVEGNLYYYETPGFDPDYARHSIGTVILLLAMEELIGNTACRVFDFGTGGDETGYKSTFGNRSLVCNAYYVMNMRRPRAVMMLAVQRILNGIKNLAARVIREGEFKNRLKRWIRKYDA